MQTLDAPAAAGMGHGGPVLDIVVPVHNEARTLEASVRQVRGFLDAAMPWTAVVTIADNGSTDATGALADRLAAELHGVRVLHLGAKGRGRALRAAWSASEAEVVAYMDVDLSTSLEALLPLVAPLVSGHSDVAIGSRLARGARVVRGPKRELISRCYNLLLRVCLGNGFTDAQCGFKAARAEVARSLLPHVTDDGWFFDTELLVVAERSDLRIHEVPVDWVDDPDSRVDLVRTAMADMRGTMRLLGARLGRAAAAAPAPRTGPNVRAALPSFARIGLLSTVAYLVLFIALRGPLGGYGADAVALALCTVANTFANRRFTFTGSPRLRARRLLATVVAVWSTSTALTMLALLALAGAGVTATTAVVAGLVAANAVAALARFAMLRAWICRSAGSGTSAPEPSMPERTMPQERRVP